MMTRRERAKQFMPFDAMKGLQEALRDREERHARTERHEIGEEEQAALSRALSVLKKGDRIRLFRYRAFHDILSEGTVTAVSFPYGYLLLDGEKVLFEDIYSLEVL